MIETGRIYMVNLKDTTHYSYVVGSRYGHDKTGRRRTGIHVQGFKHTGMVRIILDERKDLFEIHLIPDLKEKEK